MLPEDFEAIAPSADRNQPQNDQQDMTDKTPTPQSHSRNLQGVPGLSTILTDLSSSISTLGAFVDGAVTVATLAAQAFQNQVDLTNTANVAQLDFNYDAVAKGPQC